MFHQYTLFIFTTQDSSRTRLYRKNATIKPTIAIKEKENYTKTFLLSTNILEFNANISYIPGLFYVVTEQ